MREDRDYQRAEISVTVGGLRRGDLVDFYASAESTGRWSFLEILEAILGEIVPDFFLDQGLDVYFSPCEIVVDFGTKLSVKGFCEASHYLGVL